MLGDAFDDVLAAARAGGGWACTRIYEDLAPAVTGYVRQRGAAEPDDVASETFLQVFTGLDGFEGDESGFRSWVFTIAHRRTLDDYRRRARRPHADPIDEVREPVSDHTAHDDALAVDAAEQLRPHLDALSDVQRQVVLLRVVGGLSAAETGAVVGRSPEAVRQLQRRGLRALEAALTA